jgi:hypothetical protein
MVLGGAFAVPPARTIFDPGFHRPVAIVRRLPRERVPSSGAKVTLTLRDASRPGVVCRSDDPRDGCATIDWADVPDRPGTPLGGVFRNSVTVRLASGTVRLYLRRDGTLQRTPEPYTADSARSSIGGRGRAWRGYLPPRLVPGSLVRLHLVFTKLGRPRVRVAWRLAFLP